MSKHRSIEKSVRLLTAMQTSDAEDCEHADDHPLMNRMHKPDPKLGPDNQDKRSLVLLEPLVQEWLSRKRTARDGAHRQ